MTYNEIIKALEICSGAVKDGICRDCPRYHLKGNTFGCVVVLLKEALSLINRQKAEIERLQGVVRRLKQYDEERDIRLHARLAEKARVNAIKEFAERLLGLYSTCTLADTICMDALGCDIKRLVKEMVGDDK